MDQKDTGAILRLTIRLTSVSGSGLSLQIRKCFRFAFWIKFKSNKMDVYNGGTTTKIYWSITTKLKKYVK